MSAAADLNDLMKVINEKFQNQHRIFEQEKRKLVEKFEKSAKLLKEKENDNASLREQLLAAKQRNLELEKIVVDQNSLIQRMRSKLQVSFDNSFSGSTIEAAVGGRIEKPIMEDKCVATADWHTILEKELTERIERFAAYVHGKENEGSRSNGRVSLNGVDISIRSRAGQPRSGNTSIANLSIDHPDANASIANRSRIADSEFDNEYVAARAASIPNLSRQYERSSVLANGIRGTSTPATSVWQASTPLSNRHSRNNDRDISSRDHSLPFDDTLRDLSNHFGASALEADLLQRFSELETEAQALFDMDDVDGMDDVASGSKHSSISNRD